MNLIKIISLYVLDLNSPYERETLINNRGKKINHHQQVRNIPSMGKGKKLHKDLHGRREALSQLNNGSIQTDLLCHANEAIDYYCISETFKDIMYLHVTILPEYLHNQGILF